MSETKRNEQRQENIQTNDKNLAEILAEIFVKKSGLVLVSLLQDEKWTISKISKHLGISFLYSTKLLLELEKLGFITTKKEKKFRYVYLTEKGIKTAEKIKELMLLIQESGQANIANSELKQTKN